jgi:hypothetical protein
VVIQIAIHYLPATQRFFQIGTLPLADGLLALAVGLCPVTIIELRKLARRVAGAGWRHYVQDFTHSRAR